MFDFNKLLSVYKILSINNNINNNTKNDIKNIDRKIKNIK